MNAIDTQNIAKEYRARKGSVRAVDGLSLQVRQGEVFGLLGPNGAGKTTFIKMMLGIARPTGGGATVLGAPAGDLAAKARIGYLPENHRYPDFLTAAQLLRHFGRLQGLAGADLERRIATLLELTDMERWRNTKVKKYSKGMLQRIGLAQALLGEPALVFLDEPTDGVDPIGRRQIRDLLSELRARGTTVFLNSHLLSEVELICDRVAILNRGHLVRIGSVEELTSRRDTWTVTLAAPPPDALRAEWEATRAGIKAEGVVLSIPAGDLDTLNAQIDRLRAAGALIAGVERTRTSLEDSFIDVIAREEA
jgi:ABC-2 type transport system ATP-binding protein